MGRPHAWAETFGISDSDIANWQAHLAPGEDLLHWSLVNGRLPEPQYLQWAMETYELPLVKSDYFSIPADPVFWERVKASYEWRPDFFPLTEWEGVLMIACLAPPSDFYLRQPHRFVLVSPQNLESMWAVLHPNWKPVARTHQASPPAEVVPQSQPQVPAFEMPEGMSIDLTSLGDTPSLDMPSFEAASSEAPLAEENAEPEIDMPVGINTADTISGIHLDFSTLAMPQATPAQSQSPVQAPLEATAPNPDEEITQPGVAVTMTPKRDMSSEPSGTVQVQKEAREETKTSPFVSRELQAIREAAAAVAHRSPTDESPDNLIEFTTQMSSTAKPALANVPEIPFDMCRTYDELGLQTLIRAQKILNDGMILLFQGGQLKPWKWTENLLSVHGDKPNAIVLDTPSIFRIVFRTCLPYHGHVIPNPVNTRFFNDFTRGQIPAHVTITPIMIDRQIGGMLMGMTNGEVDFRNSLKRMEVLTEEMGRHLKRLRDAKAA